MTRPFETFQLNRSSPLAKGLIFWLPLLDSIMIDRVGRVAMTPTSAPSIIRLPERVGWQFLTASTQYLLGGSSPIAAAPLTINCWFYPTQITTTKDLVSLANGGNTTDLFQLQHAGSAGVRARAADTGGNTSSTTTTATVINTWQMATAVFLSTTSRSAYLNAGGVVTTTAARTPSGINRIGVGAQVSSSITSAYSGYLADIGVWNRALSASEIAALYQDPWMLYERVKKIFPIPDFF